MRAFYELTVIFLRLYTFSVLIVAFVAFSDFLFRSPHGWGALARRLTLSLIWPLALASSKGRKHLLGKFQGL